MDYFAFFDGQTCSVVINSPNEWKERLNNTELERETEEIKSINVSHLSAGTCSRKCCRKWAFIVIKIVANLLWSMDDFRELIDFIKFF